MAKQSSLYDYISVIPVGSETKMSSSIEFENEDRKLVNWKCDDDLQEFLHSIEIQCDCNSKSASSSPRWLTIKRSGLYLDEFLVFLILHLSLLLQDY